MILYGASGHGKVILDILESRGDSSIVFWDDKPISEFCGYDVSFPDKSILSVFNKVIVCIGVNSTRKKVVEKLNNYTTFGIAIHPKAIVSESAIIGDGTVVMAGAVINPSVKVGQHCIVNTCASIDHDCILDDYVHISPNATLSGDVVVGQGTHIGSGAVSIQGIRIGKWCTIGAGAVVIQDVPDFATVVGNPARIIKVNEHLNEI